LSFASEVTMAAMSFAGYSMYTRLSGNMMCSCLSGRRECATSANSIPALRLATGE
jgi:hypothetical protein